MIQRRDAIRAIRLGYILCVRNFRIIKNGKNLRQSSYEYGGAV
jgi:hypothetical protein